MFKVASPLESIPVDTLWSIVIRDASAVLNIPIINNPVASPVTSFFFIFSLSLKFLSIFEYGHTNPYYINKILPEI